MIINPKVDTRTYIEGVEVITPRGIPYRIQGVYDNTARKWLNRADAPKPIARHEGGRGDVFWKADEAIAYIQQLLKEQAEREAQGIRSVGRPRKK
jgi:hypothetical protein